MWLAIVTDAATGTRKRVFYASLSAERWVAQQRAQRSLIAWSVEHVPIGD